MYALPDNAVVTSARSARKPKGEGHSRRAEILDAAERIFIQHGYEGATIRKIADEVGLSSTALYMHFTEKSEILAEICQTAFERLIAVSESIGSGDGAPEARLRGLMEAYARFGFENPNAYRLIYLTRPQEAAGGADAANQAMGARLYAYFCQTVAQAGEAGRLRHDPAVTAQLLWAGVHGVVSLLITKPYFDWAEQEVLVGAMLDALFEGLMKP
jgi:AcrR family transcriptional regulator